MRTVLISALLAVSAPAFAASAQTDGAAVPHAGEMLRDANNLRIGAVDAVKSDGSVGVIVEARYVVVPADTLSMVDGKLVTKLSKRDVLASR